MCPFVLSYVHANKLTGEKFYSNTSQLAIGGQQGGVLLPDLFTVCLDQLLKF